MSEPLLLFLIFHMSKFFALAPWFNAAVLCGCLPGWAQTPPDAGQLLNQQLQTAPQPSRIPDFQIGSPLGGVRAIPGGPQVELKSVEFLGHSVLDEAKLLACLGNDVLGKRYDLAALQSFTDQIGTCYRERNYPFARAFLPAQQMQDGRLRLQIVEGRYGRIEASESGAERYLTALQPGSLIVTGPLEKATLLLSDLPGWDVKPVMQPGETEGTGDLLVSMQRDSKPHGSVGLDNAGSRYTGSERLRLDVSIGSPFVLGDQLGLSGLTTSGDMHFANLTYTLPLDGQGLRASFSAANSQYHLGDKFASANAYGAADVRTLGLSQAIERSRSSNLSISAQLQRKRMHDVNEAGHSDARKQSAILLLGINFDRRDDWLGEGVNYGSLTLSRGHLNLDTGLASTDASTARTAGNFGKLLLDVSRQQRLTDHGLSGYAHWVGQWTQQNLDSSEKFSLGGASGVRAYPSGEGVGDRGWLAQFELRSQWQHWNPYLFADLGQVQINARPWASGYNQRSLSGAGFGLRAELDHTSADVSVAWRIHGGTPQSDDKDRHPRVWLSLTHRF